MLLVLICNDINFVPCNKPLSTSRSVFLNPGLAEHFTGIPYTAVALV